MPRARTIRIECPTCGAVSPYAARAAYDPPEAFWARAHCPGCGPQGLAATVYFDIRGQEIPVTLAAVAAQGLPRHAATADLAGWREVFTPAVAGDDGLPGSSVLPLNAGPRGALGIAARQGMPDTHA